MTRHGKQGRRGKEIKDTPQVTDEQARQNRLNRRTLLNISRDQNVVTTSNTVATGEVHSRGSQKHNRCPNGSGSRINNLHRQQFDHEAFELRQLYAKERRTERILSLKRKRHALFRRANERDITTPLIRKKILAEDKNTLDVSYYGPPLLECKNCSAIFWENEKLKNVSKKEYPVYGLCCKGGKIKLPMRREPPEPLKSLLNPNGCRKSVVFLENIRAYNSMFSMTSMGAKVDHSVNTHSGPYIYRISGQNHHRIGSLVPPDGQNASFLQLYVHDTTQETQNRINAVNQKESNPELDPLVVDELIKMFDSHNELVKVFRQARDRYDQYGVHDLTLRLLRKRTGQNKQYCQPTASEIAMLVVGDVTSSNVSRDIVVELNSGFLRRIDDLHPSYMALQYPILFPYGEDGFYPEIEYAVNSGKRKTRRNFLTAREYYSYMIQFRRQDGHTLQLAGRLYQQFLVDSYTQIEQQRLRWIKSNQGNLRTDLYRNVYDAFRKGDSDSKNVGMRTILPSSFTGSPRYMMQNYQDAMAICRFYGNPDFFITFTANPNWAEVWDFLNELEGQKVENRPDIESRVFKMKLDEMIRDIIERQLFGEVEAVLYTIEFQKRGLPHAHIIIWVKAEWKLESTEQVDRVISAELPNPTIDPIGYDAVSQFMMHGPCGIGYNKSPCMIDGSCSKKFPKEHQIQTSVNENGYCVYRRRDMKVFVEKNGMQLDNRFVVPYNRYLLVKYQSHINVEACNKSKAIKYLFKYVTKGPDRATVVIESDNSSSKGHALFNNSVDDEIKTYLDCRYISACEAVWRIFEFDIHYRRPSVERLCYHLEDEQMVVFNDDDSIPSVVYKAKTTTTMFIAWMEVNMVDELAQTLTYSEIPSKFVWNKDKSVWTRRKSGYSIGRLTFAHPASGERYYLRLLLNVVKGPTSFQDIRTVDGVTYPSFQTASYVRGLLQDDNEWNETLEEASQWATGSKMRELFLTILLFCNISDVGSFWQSNWMKISDDILLMQRKVLRIPSLHLSEDALKNLTLAELEKMLLKNGRSLSDIKDMPMPDMCLLEELKNRLIQEEFNYNTEELRLQYIAMESQLNTEQLEVYTQVVNSVQSKQSKLFYLYGYGGTGKTFVYNAIIARLRAESKIVLAVASSGIASLLLPGGRTAHSRFRIPIVLTEESTCTIKQGTQLAELLRRSSLIIWDEAPMDHKHAFEAVDKTLKDILRGTEDYCEDKPFGGRTVLLGGDFRQILPVVPKGTRNDIVSASLNYSYLWRSCNVFMLTQNMRLQALDENNSDANVQLKKFSELILRVGDGTESARTRGDDVEPEWIKLPDSLIIESSDDPIRSIFESTYPSFILMKDNVKYLTERAILTPKNETVDDINNFVMEFVAEEEKEYMSCDTIDKSTGNVVDQEMLYPVEFLNSLNYAGIPCHKLKLKVGVPIMLLRNVNPSKGMCNGTRLIVTQLGKKVIEGCIITGSHVGDKVSIPRIDFSSSDSQFPFVMRRRQFPVRVCYAMTINKSQGQTLSYVGLYLPSPIFSHGQLYVAMSRVRNPNGLKILSLENDENYKGWTKNIVYKEIFTNIN